MVLQRQAARGLAALGEGREEEECGVRMGKGGSGCQEGGGSGRGRLALEPCKQPSRRCPRSLGETEAVHTGGGGAGSAPALTPPHLNAGDRLLEGGRLVGPGGQQLHGSLKVLDILTVHLQERGQFLDHVADAGGGGPARGPPRSCPQPQDLLS